MSSIQYWKGIPQITTDCTQQKRNRWIDSYRSTMGVGYLMPTWSLLTRLFNQELDVPQCLPKVSIKWETGPNFSCYVPIKVWKNCHFKYFWLFHHYLLFKQEIVEEKHLYGHEDLQYRVALSIQQGEAPLTLNEQDDVGSLPTGLLNQQLNVSQCLPEGSIKWETGPNFSCYVPIKMWKNCHFKYFWLFHHYLLFKQEIVEERHQYGCEDLQYRLALSIQQGEAPLTLNEQDKVGSTTSEVITLAIGFCIISFWKL